MGEFALVDTAVIVRARKGNKQALEQIWYAHHPAVIRYLRGVGIPDPDDVAADVWESVARSLRRFEGDGADFRRWLFVIARRRMIDDLRLRSNRHEELVGDMPDACAVETDRAVEGLAQATALLQRLPAPQAEVILLRVMAGFSVKETAELTDRSPASVRVMAHRGLARLREQLEGGSGPPEDPAVTLPAAPPM